MIHRHLKALTRRACALDSQAATAAIMSLACVLVLTMGLSAARSSPVGSDEAGRRVAAITGGDLSEATLEAMIAKMDAATLDLAKRFDPQVRAEATGFLPDDPRLAFAEGEAAKELNQALPFVDSVYPAPPFVLNARSGAERERAVRCLTNAIYYEAALEPLDGQRAVAQVVLNRLRDPNFPKSVCEVVYQGWERFTGCQFSFTCDGALVQKPLAFLWNQDRKVAEAALNGYVMAAVGTATHYHADYVTPDWAPSLVKINQIGRHIFYRWPGEAGEPAAFTAAYEGGELRLSEAVLSGKAARRAPPSAEKKALPGVQTAKADAGGSTHKRVQGSFAVAGPEQPAIWGRRQPTPDEIAAINAKLEARFPSKPAEAPGTAAAAPVVPDAPPLPTPAAS